MSSKPPIPIQYFHSFLVIDNFLLFFHNGFLAECQRKKDCFSHLTEESPELESRLLEEISAIPFHQLSDKKIEPFCEELYQAYLIMRKYVESDQEMGINLYAIN